MGRCEGLGKECVWLDSLCLLLQTEVRELRTLQVENSMVRARVELVDIMIFRAVRSELDLASKAARVCVALYCRTLGWREVSRICLGVKKGL